MNKRFGQMHLRRFQNFGVCFTYITVTFAAFILSTGRCGTQWIASTLSDVFSDRIDVAHEPLDDRYHPRKALASNVLPNPKLAVSGLVASHLDKIEGQCKTRSYIECGHPSWSTIPLLANRFEGNIRVIHLTRHPVFTCFSWLTHGAYQTPISPHTPPRILLSPFDEGTKFNEYQSIWKTLSPFEKCLYYWSEVNAFAIDCQSKLKIPWLRLQYEELFEGDGLPRLLNFLDLPHHETMNKHRNRVVDKFRYHSIVWDNWRKIEAHPRALAIAHELGYDLDRIDDFSLRSRYLAGHLDG